VKTYVIAALHGDELFGLKVIGKLQQKATTNCITRIGNPEAIAKGKRYIEEDLNRSFRSNQQTLEATLAKAIKAELKSYAPDYVIDIHTARSGVGKVAIVAKHCAKTAYLAQALGMDAMAIMPQHLTRTSCIGCCPDRAISLEYGKGYRSDKLAADIADSLDALQPTFQVQRPHIPVFQVVSTIPKDFEGLASIVNLAFNETLGGYPFLAGEHTYETIGGFLAKKVS
jgi:succinylglutamate desuccinylase